jgi:DNA-binding NarL/FixJ family response regulator
VSAPIRVLIADDQRVVRDGLSMLVEMMEGIEVVGVVADGAAAIDAAIDDRPDVVLMDLRMPDVDGTEATRRIARARPDTAILVLTTYADESSVLPALQAGARGYLTKDASAEQIEAAIRDVHAGRTHLDSGVQEQLVAMAVRAAPAPAGLGEAEALTARELEVLGLIADGLSNHQIAERLVVSNATVKTHINRVFAKLDVRDRAQAVRFAYEHGLMRRPLG